MKQTKLHPVLQEVIHLMRQLQSEMMKTKKAPITQQMREKGLESSKLGSSQPQEVPITPLMKHALEHYGDMPVAKDDSEKVKWRLTVDKPQTKAEKAIVGNMKQLLLQFNGSSNTFNEDIPLDSVEHYNVQCHQNMKDNLRDIQPGQAQAREKMAVIYTKPTSNDIDRIISMIERDPVFQKAILVILGFMPEVRASSEIREINVPFMTKHSGVGAPYWQNDRSIDPETGLTYAEITMRDAERIKDNPQEWYKHNISTMYGRNQRGKGRLLVAVARILNLLLNQLEAEEISAYKLKSPLFVGYNDDVKLKEALTQIMNDCMQNGLLCANEDYSSFDSTVGQGMIVLIGAMSIFKANGSRSKRIAFMRTIFATETQLMDGLSMKVKDILGRVFSGFIDTNRGGGLVNAVQMTYQCMKQDENYTSLVYKLLYYMLVMGDDNLHVYRRGKLDRKKLATDMKRDFGGIINEAKFEFGPTFLQYRVFKDPKSKEIVMVYAWTRVVRSMLMKETKKGLGPVGWTYAFYQQLFKLYEYKEAFSIAVNLLIKFDRNEFYRNVPISQLNDMLKKEDQEALSKLKTDNQKRRYQSTWDILFDGDPSKARLEDGNDGLLKKVQDRINEVYDPAFYQKYNLAY